MSDDLSEKLRSVAGQVLSGPALDSFVTYAPIVAYTTESGEIDQDKVMGHLTALHAARMAQPPQWGQASAPGGPPYQPGDGARAALRRRHGVGVNGPSQPGPHSRIAPAGALGRAALHKRHGVNRIQ